MKTYKRHAGQILLDEIVNDYDNFHVTILTSRQWGKSLYLCEYAVRTCYNESGNAIWYTAPSWGQCKIIWNKYIEPAYIRQPKLFKSINLSNMRVVFKNGSSLQFKSVENYEKLRGETLTHLICDEYAYFRDGVYEKTLSPMLDRKGKRVIFCSTPRGKNCFYDVYCRGLEGHPSYVKGWVSFKGDIYQTGNQNYIDRILAKQLTLPDAYFRQEYLGEFVDAGGGVFTNVANCFTLSKFSDRGTRFYAGLDIGKMNDYTVLTILNELGECVFWYRYSYEEQSNGLRLGKKIAEHLSKFKDIQCLVETNFDPSIFDIIYSNVSNDVILYGKHQGDEYKNKIISSLNASMQKGLTRLPFDLSIVESELVSYEIVKLGKYPVYSAPSGMHDDCVISLALANNLMCNYEGYNYQQFDIN